MTLASAATPLVSVVVPAYNYAHYLPAALDSALAQDWPDDALEVIVVDDGSTDDTPAVVASYADRGVRYVHKPNGGLNSATTRGVEEARGEFLTFLDADDVWPVDRTRRLAEVLMARPEVGLVYGDMEVVDGDEAVVAPSFRALNRMQAHEGRVLGRLMAGNFISAGALMVRTALHGCYHPIGEQAAWQDWWIAARVAPVTTVAAIPAIVNRYRSHDGNMNLGAEGTKLIGLLKREIPFRRFLLANVGDGQATLSELVDAVASLRWVLAYIAEHDGGTLADLVPVSDAQRDRACELAAQAVDCSALGDEVRAAVRFANAVGEDPTDLAIVEGLFAAVTGVQQRPQPVTPTGPAGVRRFAALAYAEELIDRPALLAAYGRAFGPNDDVTLVIRPREAHGDDELARRLHAVATAAGIDGDDSPDLAALLCPLPAPVEVELSGALRAVYTATEPPPDVRFLPRFDGASVGALRALALHSLRSAA
jgi:hypothetical protein